MARMRRLHKGGARRPGAGAPGWRRLHHHSLGGSGHQGRRAQQELQALARGAAAWQPLHAHPLLLACGPPRPVVQDLQSVSCDGLLPRREAEHDAAKMAMNGHA